jgi:hypothetical protein
MYNPQTEFRGDQYIFRGLSALGQGIAGGLGDIGEAIGEKLKEKRKEEQELQFNDDVIKHAIQTGRLQPTDDAYLDYIKGNSKKKLEISHGIIFNMAEDAKTQQQQIMNQSHQTEAYRAMQQATEAQLRSAILARTGQPVYQQPIAPGQSPAPWNKQMGVSTSTGDVAPLPSTQPEMATVPSPNGGPPLTFYKGQKGWSHIVTPTGKVPIKLSKEEQKLFSWALNRSGKTPEETDLPTDLRWVFKWAKNNPKDPRAIPAWNKIKQDLIHRLTVNGLPDNTTTSGTEADSVNGQPTPPKKGEVRAGYRFKGGDPAAPNNWEAVQ